MGFEYESVNKIFRTYELDFETKQPQGDLNILVHSRKGNKIRGIHAEETYELYQYVLYQRRFLLHKKSILFLTEKANNTTISFPFSVNLIMKNYKTENSM